MTNNIEMITKNFTEQLQAALQEEAAEKLRERIAHVVDAAVQGARKTGNIYVVPKSTRPQLSAKALQARKRQGQYLGLLRAMKGPKRERVRKTAAKKGVPAAIALALKLK